MAPLPTHAARGTLDSMRMLLAAYGLEPWTFGEMTHLASVVVIVKVPEWAHVRPWDFDQQVMDAIVALEEFRPAGIRYHVSVAW